jgi:hypothetical protein
MYLSVLAGRAVMALGKLATDPSAWNQDIESGLRDGISYCQALPFKAQALPSGTMLEKSTSALKRSVEDAPEKNQPPDDARAESEKVEEILRQVVSRRREPDLRELVQAIEFLRRTATNR